MKKYFAEDEWSVIEEGFDPAYNRVSESIMSLGNGRMGQRANFEEQYSGDTFQGTYVAGVYYPDKTRVGWWKNGYPEYFAKVLNATNWIGLDISLDGEALDLAKCEIMDFRRELNMQQGYLERSFRARMASGKELEVNTRRFLSMVDDETGAIRYTITPLNFSGTITVNAYLDGDVINEDSNYDEKFWDEISKEVKGQQALVNVRTRKLDFHVATAMHWEVTCGDSPLTLKTNPILRTKYAGSVAEWRIEEGQPCSIYKYAAVLSSENHQKDVLETAAWTVLDHVVKKGFDQMMSEQIAAWTSKWAEGDIQIEGDIAAQQGIRFNIFQLWQTYTGEDERLNIGPKGFTGEKYGGSTYWDTEAYCLPFYLSTADQRVARNLLVYRYKHLQKAIENAAKLGFTDGAALYPMVTMNGEECHNEWEITFEEIHRNGAIAYAIHSYINYTGDKDYLAEYGLEVLIGIARFWSQRINWSEERQQYVMLGVTGPNEYDNNVNNNWYTSTIACWSMDYARESLDWVKAQHPERYAAIMSKAGFEEKEMERWAHISDNMYFPYDEQRQIFLQQDGYLDKVQQFAREIPEGEYPIHKHWSWDRILRSCFIKQPDVLLGLYFFEERYDEDTLRRNFEFYEPRTVHESSLSPCIHSIQAAKLGMKEKAYEMYLRTARLDLDNYNHDTDDGCHTTSMAGTWMSVVYGFGGMRVKEGELHLNPYIPAQWGAYAFNIRFRDAILRVEVQKEGVNVINNSNHPVRLFLFEESHTIQPESQEVFTY